jgi:hypothetical protein
VPVAAYRHRPLRRELNSSLTFDTDMPGLWLRDSRCRRPVPTQVNGVVVDQTMLESSALRELEYKTSRQRMPTRSEPRVPKVLLGRHN